MNVASLELCKELYEVSGWQTDIYWAWYGHRTVNTKYEVIYNRTPECVEYAYDLGYLLRKLPKEATGSFYVLSPTLEGWGIGYLGTDFVVSAGTPEDCAAQLAIELFKQGVLSKDS